MGTRNGGGELGIGHARLDGFILTERNASLNSNVSREKTRHGLCEYVLLAVQVLVRHVDLLLWMQ